MTLSALFFKFYDFCVRNAIHLIAWSCFIPYDIWVSGTIMGRFGQIGTYIILYVTAIILFYLHAALLKIVIIKNRLPLTLIVVLVVVIFELCASVMILFALRYTFSFLNLMTVADPRSVSSDFIYSNIWRGIYFIGFGTGYFYIEKFLQNQKMVEELRRKVLLEQIEKHSLENSLINAQNNYLRSQINPHFLFNTLNFIYNDARKKAPVAADAIMNLSEMMRYALKRSEAVEVVPIVDEIAQIEHLIQIHSLRTKNALNINLHIEGELVGVRFPPLILLTLVENMFKHGNLIHPTHAAIISLKHFDHILQIKLSNIIGPIQRNNAPSHKVGVANTITRLQHIYKEHCSFTHSADPIKNTYTTELTVNLAYNPKKNKN